VAGREKRPGRRREAATRPEIGSRIVNW